MTTPQNNVDVLHRNYSAVRLPVTTNLTVNPGDLVYWDPTNFTVTPLTATAQVANQFLGIAVQGNNNPIYPNDPFGVGVEILAHATVWLNSTAGETYNPFDDVTIGADSQTVVKAGATAANRVGFVVIDPPLVARPNQATPVPETVGGAASTRIRVALEPKHKYAAAV